VSTALQAARKQGSGEHSTPGSEKASSGAEQGKHDFSRQKLSGVGLKTEREKRKIALGCSDQSKTEIQARLAPSGGSLKLSSDRKSQERETQKRSRSEEHTQPQNKNGDETHKRESKFLLHKNQMRFTYNHRCHHYPSLI
jgi:hypothetical protein